jgi:methylmalonyl-CoA/ethylmalonyl-CoA epimerase
VSRVVEGVEEVVLAVENQDEVVGLFEDLFDLDFKDSWTVPADNMKVRCAHVGNTQFHVVASTAPEGLIPKFIRQRGEGLHHIAFRVRNLDDVIARLREKGARLVPEQPRSGQHGSRYIFVHPASVHGLLIELIERP